MNPFLKTSVLAILISLASCNNSSRDNKQKATTETKSENFNTKPENIVKDFDTWYNYTYLNIHLAQDFIAFDTNSSVLNKTQFLNRLSTGKFLAIRTGTKDSVPIYKLFRLDKSHANIASTIMQLASYEISNYKMEGRELPDFEFTDLNGVAYNKTTTKGKILILKCWFIHCLACVREFPELNKLADEYRQDHSIEFVSLASDNRNDLLTFLKNNQFKYAVIPKCDKYMTQSLGIQCIQHIYT